MGQDRFNILINARSGTVLERGEEAIRAVIADSGLVVSEVCFSAPEEMSAQLKRLIRDKTPLLIGGGDGTVLEVAKALSGESLSDEKPFGVLPFGTMNLMARDLGLDTLEQALTGYAAGHEMISVDAGMVNSEMFLCCASIGTMPNASVFREENRSAPKLLLIPRLFIYVLDHLEKNKKQRIRLRIDRRKQVRFRAAALAVSVNRFTESDLWTSNRFKRGQLDGGELAIYAFETKSTWSHLRLLLRLITGGWLKDPDLSQLVGQTATVKTRRRHERVSIDGEVVELRTPLEFRVRPKAVRLWVPKAPETTK